MFAKALAHWSVLAASFAGALTSASAQTANSSVVPRQLWPLHTIEVMAARPKECTVFGPPALERATTGVSWGHVKALDARQRCARLAQGLTHVLSQPSEVAAWFVPAVNPARPGVQPEASSDQSPAPAPLWPAEHMLLARAWLRSGETNKAFAEFSRLQTQHALADWHVFAIHDFAVSAARVGRFDVAVVCYRRLASLLQWLPPDMRVSVTLEAASALLHTAPARASEALGMLGELPHQSVDPNVSFIAVVLRMVALGVQDPSQPLSPLPLREGRFELPRSIRLVDEDVHFFHAVARYQELGHWSTSDGGGDAPPALTSTAFGAMLSRLRAER